MSINTFVSNERRIECIKFSIVNMRTNLFFEYADSLRMVGWNQPIPKSNFTLDHLVACLKAAIKKAIQGHKTECGLASLHVLEQNLVPPASNKDEYSDMEDV